MHVVCHLHSFNYIQIWNLLLPKDGTCTHQIVFVPLTDEVQLVNISPLLL